MGDVREYVRERVGGAVVEERLRKREQRQQRGRRKAVGAEGRGRIGADLVVVVERRWIESADFFQLVNQLAIDDSGGGRRREVDRPTRSPPPVIAVDAGGAEWQRAP